MKRNKVLYNYINKQHTSNEITGTSEPETVYSKIIKKFK